MSDASGLADADDQALTVQITPDTYGVRARWFISAGVLVTAVGIVVVDWLDTAMPVAYGLAALVYGIYCAVQARRRVTRVLLQIDADGVRSDNGQYDHSWAGVIMVWVGSSTGLRLPRTSNLVICLFTDAGLSFARRAGTPFTPLLTVPVAARYSIPQLCERLGALAPRALVVDGTQVSRRRAADTLRTPKA